MTKNENLDNISATEALVAILVEQDNVDATNVIVKLRNAQDRLLDIAPQLHLEEEMPSEDIDNLITWATRNGAIDLFS
ncbi:hypothetical protein SEA_RIKSENGUPTA_16 [Microbacterium phage RikSengupta]|nr:hypothetical protein SEA_TINYMINY_16 [Microbacterium phage TinyMiny]WMI33112.1 hypothetical protein SEA_RIKSENGUPTA_16 [Microbacterium phage RikSengupta]